MDIRFWIISHKGDFENVLVTLILPHDSQGLSISIDKTNLSASSQEQLISMR